MNKTVNQMDLAGGLPPSTTVDSSPSDEEISNLLSRLQRIDFSTMEAKDAGIHARVMHALLGKIVRRHDELLKLRDEVEKRTRDASQAANEADLAGVLADLHREMKPTRQRRRSWRAILSLGILPGVR